MKTFSFDTIVRDPGVFADNRLAAHSDHVTYASAAEMTAGESSLRLRLDGLWKFRYSANPAAAPDGFWAKDFDLSGWWTLWPEVRFDDDRTACGRATKFFVYESGSV